MRLTFTNGKFICHSTFEERLIPKAQKFTYDPVGKFWFTRDPSIAARLREYADTVAKKEIDRVLICISPWSGSIPYPDKEKVEPFQLEAAIYALSRNRSYLALDPGLGKTIVACLIANSLNHQKKNDPTVPWSFIYLCPPFLTRNVEEEWNRWYTFAHTTQRLEGGKISMGGDFIIVPDSLLIKMELRVELEDHINHGKTRGKKFCLIVDEAHRYKNFDSKRTRALLGEEKEYGAGLTSLFDKVIYMSGTPMPNRPMELFPILTKSAPEVISFKNRFEFGVYYCGGFKHTFGWDFTGATNTIELGRKLKDKFMLRLKKDVLKLPPKIEAALVVSDDMPPRLTRIESRILSKYSPEDIMAGKLLQDAIIRGDKEIGDDLHLMTYRRLLGMAKVSSAAEYVSSILEDTDEAVLVFACHKDVISALEINLAKYSPMIITGDTPMNIRQDRVKLFQADPKRRLFIGNIQAAGTGFTMTKASRVVFAEFDWVPGNNDQASDRAHRYGQSHSVFVEYLVFKNSIDKTVVDVLLSKRKTIQHI